MLHARIRVALTTTRLVRRDAALAAVLGAALLAAACSGSPTGPGTITAERRVQTGSGGGTLCTPGEECTGFQGTVEITAAGGTLSGSSTGASEGDDTSFRVTAQALAGTGRFETGFIDAEITRESADIVAIWFRSAGGTFEVKGVEAPATVNMIRVEQTKDCPSGTAVQTTISTVLQHFGPTTIVETHCLQ